MVTSVGLEGSYEPSKQEQMKQTDLKEIFDIIKDELNVKEIRFVPKSEQHNYVRFSIKPNFSKLGPRFGQRLSDVVLALACVDPNAVKRSLDQDGFIFIDNPKNEPLKPDWVPFDVSDEKIKFSTEEVQVIMEVLPTFR